MRWSKHSISRSKQRGIPSYLIEILYRYGRTRYANGALIIDMDKNGTRALLTDEPALGKQVIHKLWRVYLVVVDEILVTAGTKNNRFKNRFK